MDEREFQRLIETVERIISGPFGIDPEAEAARAEALLAPVSSPTEFSAALAAGRSPQIVNLDQFLGPVPQETFTPTPTEGLESAIQDIAGVQREAAAAGVTTAEGGQRLALLNLLNSIGTNISQAIAPTPESLSAQQSLEASQGLNQAQLNLLEAQQRASATNATAAAQQNLAVEQFRFNVAERNAETQRGVNRRNIKAELDRRLSQTKGMIAFGERFEQARGIKQKLDLENRRNAQKLLQTLVRDDLTQDAITRRAAIARTTQQNVATTADVVIESINQGFGQALNEINSLVTNVEDFESGQWPFRSGTKKEVFRNNVDQIFTMLSGIQSLRNNVLSASLKDHAAFEKRGLREEAAEVITNLNKAQFILNLSPRIQGNKESNDDYAEFLVRWNESPDAERLRNALPLLIEGDVPGAVREAGGQPTSNMTRIQAQRIQNLINDGVSGEDALRSEGFNVDSLPEGTIVDGAAITRDPTQPVDATTVQRERIRGSSNVLTQPLTDQELDELSDFKQELENQ